MTSDIGDIYSRFYLKAEDYKIAGLDQDIANEILKGYLQSTISKPFTRKLFSFISSDFDVGEIKYIMRSPLDDSSDKDFVEETLALGMVC